jgi:DNA replication protein DnaC
MRPPSPLSTPKPLNTSPITLPAGLPSLPPVAPDPACERCHGAGFWLYAVPYGDPRFGVPQRCACYDAALSAARQQRQQTQAAALTAQLHTEMGKLRDCTLASLDRNRPYAPVTWRGTTYSPKDQRALFSKALGLAGAFQATGEGLYLYGPNGTGKSHLVAAVLNAATEAGIEARYGHAPALLRLIRQGFRDNSADDRLEALSRVTVLGLDDLGAETASEWATAQLFDLLKSRDAAGLSTVITSNLPVEELPDPRVASLIQGNSMVLGLITSDYRAVLRAARTGGSTQC